ncbi:MAG: asparaginase [Acidimicrobiales bacterium]
MECAADPPVVATVTRSGVVESTHRGIVAGLDTNGGRTIAIGPVEQPVFGRSSNKPLQAVAMVRAGLGVRGELLALVAASHSGEPFHIKGVRRLLEIAGLDEDSLGCPVAPPLGPAARDALLRAGEEPGRVHMNCSGKHAGMLITCVVNGWPTESYLDADHPLQRHITDTIGTLAGEAITSVGIDGCGAPVHALSMHALARAFRVVATAGGDTPEGAVAAAIRGHPSWVGGRGRDVTRLLEVLPGLVAKDGAEGVYAAATADGRAVALKIVDGSARARVPVLLAALGALGVDVPAVGAVADVTVLGGGRPVGAVEAEPMPPSQSFGS